MLISPDGQTQVTLFNAGDLSGSTMVNTSFSDTATTSIKNGTSPYTGVFQVAGLSQFQNMSLLGTWTLQVTNIAGSNAGTLVSWSLGITPTVPSEPAPPQQLLPAQAEGALFVRDTTSGNGLWYAQPSSPSDVPIWFNNGQVLGTASDIPLQGDFDGDGKIDLATYNQTTAVWTISDSTRDGSTFVFGTPKSATYPGSMPVVGNFNGPGASEIGVFDIVTTTSGQVGQWTITSLTSGAQKPIQFGLSGDIPVPGDYDGVGHDELAVYRPVQGRSSSTRESATLPGRSPPPA